MKNKKIILLGLLLAGCTSTVNTVTPTSSPSATNQSSSASPVISSSSMPTATVSSVPTSFSPTPSLNPSSIPTTQSSDSPLSDTTGLLQLNSGYLKTPDTAFLVEKPFNINIKFSLDVVPGKDQRYTLFDLYDNNSSPKRSHYSLSIDQYGLSVKAQGITKSISNNISLGLTTNRQYNVNFTRDNNKITVLLNGNSVFSDTIDADDFTDVSGKRTLNIGADLSGANLFFGKIDNVDVKDIIYYEFNKNITDLNKYRLDPTLVGTYNLISPEISQTPTPIATVTPTPVVSFTPVPERNVTDKSGLTKLDLQVYDPRDIDQLVSCQNRNEELKKQKITNLVDCYDERGVFTSSGFDLGTETGLSTELGDFRFITNVITDNINRISIAGNGGNPQVNIIDIGPKIFEGVDKDFLMNKVDYTNNKRIYSTSNVSSPVVVDHVYAIRTNRYGAQPRYGKVIVNTIYTEDYENKNFPNPTINSQPQYTSPINGKTSYIDSSVDYTYYVSTYDGNGETVPAAAQVLTANPGANGSAVKINLTVPFGAKGYSIYRQNNTTLEITKIGPLLSKINTPFDFYDYNDKGSVVSSLPTRDTTNKTYFAPDSDSKPREIEFSYYLYGSP